MSQHRESGCLNGESGSVDADSGSEDGEDDDLKARKNNFTTATRILIIHKL